LNRDATLSRVANHVAGVSDRTNAHCFLFGLVIAGWLLFPEVRMKTPKVKIGPYVRQTIQETESLHAVGNIHWASFVGPVMFALFASWFIYRSLQWGWPDGQKVPVWLGFTYLLALLPLLQTVLIFISTESAVTNKRVLLKTGFIARRADEISISKVETVSIKQGILGRVFDYGTVLVHGTGGNGLTIFAIASPMQFRQVLQHVLSTSNSHSGH
jgi:membrane protein YdbS with pleckstrin-like domain